VGFGWTPGSADGSLRRLTEKRGRLADCESGVTSARISGVNAWHGLCDDSTRDMSGTQGRHESAWLSGASTRQWNSQYVGGRMLRRSRCTSHMFHRTRAKSASRRVKGSPPVAMAVSGRRTPVNHRYKTHAKTYRHACSKAHGAGGHGLVSIPEAVDDAYYTAPPSDAFFSFLLHMVVVPCTRP
jgi:hypothetical protein